MLIFAATPPLVHATTKIEPATTKTEPATTWIEPATPPQMPATRLFFCTRARVAVHCTFFIVHRKKIRTKGNLLLTTAPY